MDTQTALLWEMEDQDDCIKGCLRKEMVHPFHYLPHSVGSNAVWLTASLWSYFRSFREHYGLRHFQILYSSVFLFISGFWAGFGACCDGWRLQNLCGFPFIPSFLFSLIYPLRRYNRSDSPSLREHPDSHAPPERTRICFHVHTRCTSGEKYKLYGFSRILYIFLVFELDFSVTCPLNLLDPIKGLSSWVAFLFL